MTAESKHKGQPMSVMDHNGGRLLTSPYFHGQPHGNGILIPEATPSI